MSSILRLSVLIPLAAACGIGPKAETFYPAHQPYGADVTIRMGNTQILGELLEARDTALVVLRDKKVTLVPYRALTYATVPRAGLRIGSRGPSAAHRDRLRLVTRFPQGLSPALERELLAAYGQDSFVVVQP